VTLSAGIFNREKSKILHLGYCSLIWRAKSIPGMSQVTDIASNWRIIREVQAGAGLSELQRFGKGKASSKCRHFGHSKRIRAGIEVDVPSTGCCGNGRGT
jgi:hypothetical protein